MSIFTEFLKGVRFVPLFSWVAMCLAGATFFVVSYNVNKNHPNPAAREYETSFFPKNGEVHPSSQVLMGRLEDGKMVRLAEIEVSLEEFRNRLSESPEQVVIVVEDPGVYRDTSQFSTTLHYWLWRDGFYYHTTTLLPEVDWGSYFFRTVWEHKSGVVWVASPYWDNFELTIMMFFGAVCFLIAACFLVAGLVAFGRFYLAT